MNIGPDLSAQISGWLSVATSIVSLIALVLVLITYALFQELRNIPGWNLINLSIALMVAQSSFLAGAFMSEIVLACFIVSLITHYGFLASFFWMNIIAFDMFRNFRDKSSLVLLKKVEIKSRLYKYALYGWISPIIIVLVGLTLDLSLKDPQLNRFVDFGTFTRS
jgi:G protein-coupled receptor Mth (Methuselah protein)